MKKTLKKFIGLIALITTMLLTVAGCSLFGSPLLKIINQNDETINKVVVWGLAGVPGTFDNLNITKGQSKTLTLDREWDNYQPRITVFFGNNGQASIESGLVWMYNGDTLTITLTAEGTLKR